MQPIRVRPATVTEEPAQVTANCAVVPVAMGRTNAALTLVAGSPGTGPGGSAAVTDRFTSTGQWSQSQRLPVAVGVLP